VALAKAVGYQSAGTVEFVVGKDRSFYFLEMNTRLQVEHPVTECITGLDLVEHMIRIAAGEPLGFTQNEVKRIGWAMECRINAEDPFRNFLPSTGRLVRFLPPASSMTAALPVPEDGGVRVDTGVIEGGEIPMHYDSMIAKLIVRGTDRSDATAKMRAALNAFVIRGISSNIPFQSALLAHPKFAAGDFNTGFIASEYPDGFSVDCVTHDDPAFLVALAAVLHDRAQSRAPHGRIAARRSWTVVLSRPDGSRSQVRADVAHYDSQFEVEIDGQKRRITLHTPLCSIVVEGDVDGVPFHAQAERTAVGCKVAHNGAWIDALVIPTHVAPLEQLMPFKAPPDLSKVLLSPMPGLLVDIAVQVGQKVLAGEKLATIEAMKMENILFATQDCVVSELESAKGDSLAVDQVILRFE
jgi:propionyl-CoA carboxylase alpha chain